jgi:hypothetical protein
MPFSLSSSPLMAPGMIGISFQSVSTAPAAGVSVGMSVGIAVLVGMTVSVGGMLVAVGATVADTPQLEINKPISVQQTIVNPNPFAFIFTPID